MRIVLIALLTLTACNGSLTDEQRKRLNAGLKKNEIRKLSDAQITDAAFAMGRSLSRDLNIADRKSADSIERKAGVKISFPDVRHKGPENVETQIIDAYAHADESTTLADNVQKMEGDSLLYTKPIVKINANGLSVFQHAIAIRMSRKQVILSMK